MLNLSTNELPRLFLFVLLGIPLSAGNPSQTGQAVCRDAGQSASISLEECLRFGVKECLDDLLEQQRRQMLENLAKQLRDQGKTITPPLRDDTRERLQAKLQEQMRRQRECELHHPWLDLLSDRSTGKIARDR